MGNERYICGECDNPVKLDDSLKQLNPSQLNLILNAKKNKEFIKVENELNPEDYLSTDKLNLYNQLPKQAVPIHYKNYFDSEDEDSDDEINFHLTKSNSSTDSYLVVDEVESEQQDEPIEEEGFELKLSSRIKALENIFNILSNTQDIKHPLVKIVPICY